MKTRTIICIMLLFISGMFVSSNNVDAKTYEFERNVIESKKYLEYVSELSVNKNNEVQYIDYSSTKKDYQKMDIYTINKNTAKKTNSFKAKIKNFERFNIVKIIDGKILMLNYDSDRICIREYDDKGICDNEIKIKEFPNRKKYICYLVNDIWDDGNNIYYMYWKSTEKDSKYIPRYILCKINKKTKKITRRSLNIDGHSSFLNNEYIYELCEKEINIYSLKGKKLSTITLPEGETDYEVNVDTDDYKNLSTHEAGVYGKFLYYCNKNGVYRCNIKNLNKNNKFKQIYDAGNDEFFGHDYLMEEIFIKDKDTFFVKVVHTSDLDACADDDDTKFVKYTRKK